MREQRRKEEELKKLRDEIKQFIVEKGEVRDHVAQIELLDIFGSYEKGKSYIGSVGGQIMQICVVLKAIDIISN